MFDLKAYLSDRRKHVNDALSDRMAKLPAENRLVAAMHYALMAGGKRLRPILCIAAAEAVGGRWQDTLDTCCALEMIHTYSLIHDDLPAMDDDALRRGKPTCHVAFDEATAILAGDALLTLAFEVLAADDFSPRDPKRQIDVIRLVSRAAGYQGMVQGQMLDMASEDQTLSMEALESMHALKTGAILTAAVAAGAVVAGAAQQEIQNLQAYGRHIGLAFQVTDDILNIEGDPKILGKSVGTDQVRRKNTYPGLLGVASAKALGRSLVNKALQALRDFDIRSDPLRAIASYIVERNH